MSENNEIYAVIDTNVLVSALFSVDGLSNPAIVIESILDGLIIPIYNDDIIEEYKDLLSRKKFNFPTNAINGIISIFINFGIHVDRILISHDQFIDEDDVVFYEVKMNIEDSYLVTGNIRHFPKDPSVVTPKQMVEILMQKGLLI